MMPLGLVWIRFPGSWKKRELLQTDGKFNQQNPVSSSWMGRLPDFYSNLEIWNRSKYNMKEFHSQTINWTENWELDWELDAQGIRLETGRSWVLIPPWAWCLLDDLGQSSSLSLRKQTMAKHFWKSLLKKLQGLVQSQRIRYNWIERKAMNVL